MPLVETKQKIYAYVDESGQDHISPYFVVVVVLSHADQNELRQKLQEVEEFAGTGRKKWHKLRQKNRVRYLAKLTEENFGESVYFGKYRKPISFLAAMSNVIAKAIQEAVAGRPYRATVYIDGIDKQKAQEITNVLRAGGIRLGLVKGRRDESEPLIRLADMWAGCIRAAGLRNEKCGSIMIRAMKTGYLIETTKT